MWFIWFKDNSQVMTGKERINWKKTLYMKNDWYSLLNKICIKYTSVANLLPSFYSSVSIFVYSVIYSHSPSSLKTKVKVEWAKKNGDKFQVYRSLKKLQVCSVYVEINLSCWNKLLLSSYMVKSNCNF